VSTRRPPHQGRRLDGRHGEGSQPSARVVRERDAWLARLGCVPRRPQAIPPVCATVVVPSPGSTRPSRVFSAARGATRAMHAGWRDPASPPGANARETCVACMADVPGRPVGLGQHCHGSPVERTPNRRFTRRGEPSVPRGPRVGSARCGTRQAVHSGADHGTGLGVRAGCVAVGRIMGGPPVKQVDSRWQIQISPHPTTGYARVQNTPPVPT
jgi:hypothetical protein